GVAARAQHSDPTRSAQRSYACDQPIERAGNHAPVAEPIARETHDDFSRVDAAFIETYPRGGTGAVAAAAHEKGRCSGIIDQVLALIRRAVAKGEKGKPVRAGHWLGRGIAWIERARTLGPGKRVAGGVDRHEHGWRRSG